MQLHIPAPCDASWQGMTPTDKGRHCGACQKEVVDFTRMTDAEVFAWMQARAGQKVCARMRADQQVRELAAVTIYPPAPAASRTARAWARLATLASTLWLFIQGGGAEALAQAKPRTVQQAKGKTTRRAAGVKPAKRKAAVRMETLPNKGETFAQLQGDVVEQPLVEGLVVSGEPAPSSDGEGLTSAEVMPQPPYDLAAYLAQAVRYPEQAVRDSVQGTVYVRFVVGADGGIHHPQVTKGIGAVCDEAAVAALAAMPPWKPGSNGGQPVPVQIAVPVRFRLPVRK